MEASSILQTANSAPSQSSTRSIVGGRKVSTLSFDPTKIRKAIERDDTETNTFLDSEFSTEGLLCQLCGETFSTQTSLDLHMRLHTAKEEQYLRVPERPRLFYSPDGEEEEDIMDDGVPRKRRPYRRTKKYECSICQKKFGSKDGIRSHMKIHSGETPFRCPMCEKRFALGRNLHRHIVTLHQDHEGDAAEFCAKLMQEVNSHENRKIVYTGDKQRPYKCGICSKTFRRLYRVKSHTRSHSGQKPFMCSFCSKLFSSSDNLYRHVKRIHNGGSGGVPRVAKSKKSNTTQEQVVVPEPQPEQEKVNDFGSHATTTTTIIQIQDGSGSTYSIPVQQGNTNEVTFLQNPRQGEIFTVNTEDVTDNAAPTYYIDLRTSEITPAPQIDVQMVQQENPLVQVQQQQHHAQIDFQNHHIPDNDMGDDGIDDIDHHDPSLMETVASIATHSSQGGAFQCSICRETFASGPLLTKHISTHKFNTPCKCHICGKEFKVESYLKRHMICHTDEKPFKCSMCPKAFNRQYRLNNHWRTHTGEKPYACSICEKTFAVSDNLYKHIRKIHKGLGMEYAANLVKQVQEVNREKKYALLYGDYEVIEEEQQDHV